MSDRFYAGTRKGLFTFVRDAGGSWKIERVDFLGEPVTMLLPDPRDGMLYASLTLGHFGVKLHRSSDGAQWEECAVPVYPESASPDANGDNAEPATASDGSVEAAAGEGGANGQKADSLKEIWALEAGGPEEEGLLWAGTIPGGLFRSRDRGSSWELIRPLWDDPRRSEWFGGGKDDPGIHSVCVDPRNSGTLLAGVSCGGVWVSEDGGESWDCRADGMIAEYMPPEMSGNPNIQDAHRLVQCPAAPDTLWVQHHNGVFRSTDRSASWHQIENVPPSKFGFAVAVHPQDPDTAWFVPAVKDECRVPVDGQVVVSRTRDGGRSFDVLRNGLPQENAYDIVFRHGLDVDETGDRLVMGSSTGSLWISEDGGDAWESLGDHFPQVYCVRFAP